jgi:hypothetical protein
MTVSFTAWYYTVLNTFRLHWPEWVQIQWNYSYQENLYCHEESEQFAKTSNHYKLFLKTNATSVKKMQSNSWHFVNASLWITGFFFNICASSRLH